MAPIQLEALARRGNSAATILSSRRSRNVVHAPMMSEFCVVSIGRKSEIPHRLTSFAAFSLPAAWATINSVPPAIGVHWPGSSASKASTASRLPGAISSCASALPRMSRLGCSRLQVLCGGREDRIEDALEPSAAAKISGKPLANFSHRGMRILRQQLSGCNQHSRRADAALRPSAMEKSLLQRVKLTLCSDAFDRLDASAPRLKHRHEATVHKLAIHAHRAGAALAFAAALFRPGQMQIFAQHIEQRLHRRDTNIARC